MTGLKLYYTFMLLLGIVAPVLAYQVQEGADVANHLIDATGSRAPELLIMLFSFLVFSAVVFFFIKSQDKKDKLLMESQRHFTDTVTNIHNNTVVTVAENTAAHKAALELTGRVLQKLDDLDRSTIHGPLVKVENRKAPRE